MNYYSEWDKTAAAWLRQLIKDKLIPAGVVDTRSIADVSVSDLHGFTQCHFFAGIGGWSYALKLAGWPADRPVWTGSCPCQPFSQAGKQLGDKDERHLWPALFNLIAQCHPEFVFGEQVANAVGKGWLDGISADLEGAGYACGAAVLGAHSVGAPHIRQRLYWVANAGHESARRSSVPGETESGRSFSDATGRSVACGMEHSTSDGRIERRPESGRRGVIGGCGKSDPLVGVGNADRARSQPGQPSPAPDRYRRAAVADGAARGMGDANSSRLQQQCGAITVSAEQPSVELRGNTWDQYDLLPCTDGKTRRVKSGVCVLAHGVPARVGRLRGYGNAIVPQAAAEFIIACDF